SAIQKDGVVQHFGSRRVRDDDCRVRLLDRAGLPPEHVVADNSALVVVAVLPFHEAEANAHAAIDHDLALDRGIFGTVPEVDAAANLGVPVGAANVAKQVVAHDPVGAGVDRHALGIVVPGGPSVLENAAFDGAIVRPAALAVGIGLEELLARVEQADVANADALAAELALQRDGVKPDVADGQVGDQYVGGIADHDAVRYVAVVLVGHASALEDHLAALRGRAAQGHVLHVPLNVQRIGQVISAG